MPPPTYNPVWLDEFGADNRTSSPRHQMAAADDTPHVMVHQPGGGSGFHRQASINEQSEVKVPLLTGSTTSGATGNTPAYQSTYDQARPLLNRSSLVECRYQSTQDSGYEQSQDECNFPPPLDIDYGDPLHEEPFISPMDSGSDPPPPEVAFESSLDYAYEQDLAHGLLYRPSEDDGYAESCASSSQNTGDQKVPCDHARNQCAYMNTSPFGDFMPNTATSEATLGASAMASRSGMNTLGNSGSLQNGNLHHNKANSPLRQMHSHYPSSLSPAHNHNRSLSVSPHHHQNGGTHQATNYDLNRDIPLNKTMQASPPATLPLQQVGATGGQLSSQASGSGISGSTRNIARLTLDGLELEIQVAPQNCYSGFAPETILRASKTHQRTPVPKICNVVNPEEGDEIILSDVSDEVSMTPEPSEYKGPARMCRNCCLRVAAFLAHIGFFVCVVILGIQIPVKKQYDVHIFILRHDENAQNELPKPYDEVALITACIMLSFCYLVALGESYTADTDTFVNNAMSRDVLTSYVRELREQVPIVGWDVICYHLETRQVTRTTRDRWGNETTSTTEEEVKVMTHRETLRFPFRIVKDISGEINLKGTAITKMEFHQMYGFLDRATAQKFTQIKEKLKERNRYRDEKMEFKEIFAMDNLKAHVTVFGEYGCLRQLMRPKIFCFFSCFLCSWPFRLILKVTTKKRKYTVIKVLGL